MYHFLNSAQKNTGQERYKDTILRNSKKVHCLSFFELRLLIYPFGIIKLCYWPLHCLSCDLRLLIYPFGIIKLCYWPLHCLSFDLRLLNYPFCIIRFFFWLLYCLSFFVWSLYCLSFFSWCSSRSCS
jgi:hypothetical protein